MSCPTQERNERRKPREMIAFIRLQNKTPAKQRELIMGIGGDGWARTTDLRIMKPSLWPPELRRHMEMADREPVSHLFGSGGRTRTCGLRVMSPTSCHCSTPHHFELLYTVSRSSQTNGDQRIAVAIVASRALAEPALALQPPTGRRHAQSPKRQPR